MSTIVESVFVHEGYKCAVIMTDMGHRCGYVGIPQRHPLYGVDWSDDCTTLDGTSPGNFFEVHGGLTYSGNGKHLMESNLWWFGYDCAHWNDAFDPEYVADPRLRILLGPTRPGVVRTKEYCEDECKKLASQLKQFDVNRHISPGDLYKSLIE